MATQFPLHRFQEFGPLNKNELEAINTLGLPPTSFSRHQIIRREGEKPAEVFLLLQGWVASCIILPDGGRQILKFHLPGDVLGSPSMSCEYTVETLTAVTNAVVVKVPLERLGRIFTDHPRIATFFLLSVQRERVALMDQLASMGRTSSESRLAALILDIYERLLPLGMVMDNSYEFPLTQELIGDFVGLTAVHVNRVMRVLTDRGLISRQGQRMTILNAGEMTHLAARPTRPFRTDLSWLPPAK